MTTTRIAPSRSASTHVVDGDLDEVRLPEDVPVDRHARRQRLLDVVQRAVELSGQGQRVGAGLLLDAEDHCRLALGRALAALDRRADAHVGQMTDTAPAGRH